MLFEHEATILSGSIFSRQIRLVLSYNFTSLVNQPGIISDQL